MNSLFDTTELEFRNMVQWHENTAHRKNATSTHAVLQYLIDHPNKIWHWSWEFVGKTTSTGGWLSHRAPARASDLAIHHPDLVEDRKIGRYKVYRLRTENITKIKEFLHA